MYVWTTTRVPTQPSTHMSSTAALVFTRQPLILSRMSRSSFSRLDSRSRICTMHHAYDVLITNLVCVSQKRITHACVSSARLGIAWHGTAWHATPCAVKRQNPQLLGRSSRYESGERAVKGFIFPTYRVFHGAHHWSVADSYHHISIAGKQAKNPSILSAHVCIHQNPLLSWLVNG